MPVVEQLRDELISKRRRPGRELSAGDDNTLAGKIGSQTLLLQQVRHCLASANEARKTQLKLHQTALSPSTV